MEDHKDTRPADLSNSWFTNSSMLVCSVPPFGHDTDSLDDVSCWSSHVFSFCIGFTWQCSLLFVFRGGNIHNFEGIYAKGYYHGCGLRTQLPQAYFYDIFLQSLSLSPCYCFCTYRWSPIYHLWTRRLSLLSLLLALKISPWSLLEEHAYMFGTGAVYASFNVTHLGFLKSNQLFKTFSLISATIFY